MKNPFMKVTVDHVWAFNQVIEALRDKETLVGIPEQKAQRKKEDEEGPINNAALLYLNNFGSPAQNIPPRPVMEIGIRTAQREIVAEMRSAALSALSDGPVSLNKYYERAGFIASTSVKRTINDQIGIEGPSEATLAIRESRGFEGTKSLVVTAQMRNAITHVVSQRGLLRKVSR